MSKVLYGFGMFSLAFAGLFFLVAMYLQIDFAPAYLAALVAIGFHYFVQILVVTKGIDFARSKEIFNLNLPPLGFLTILLFMTFGGLMVTIPNFFLVFLLLFAWCVLVMRQVPLLLNGTSRFNRIGFWIFAVIGFLGLVYGITMLFLHGTQTGYYGNEVSGIKVTEEFINLTFFLLIFPGWIFMAFQFMQISYEPTKNFRLPPPDEKHTTKNLRNILHFGRHKYQLKAAELLGDRISERALRSLRERLGMFREKFYLRSTESQLYTAAIREEVAKSIAKIEAHHRQLAQVDTTWCTECNRRPEPALLEFAESALCPKCNAFHHLKTGVEIAVGVIGDQKEAYPANHYPVNLWNQASREIIPMQIDRVDILPGDVNYDWAIAALAKIADENPLLRGRSIDFTVHPKVKLSENALRMLQQLAQRGKG